VNDDKGVEVLIKRIKENFRFKTEEDKKRFWNFLLQCFTVVTVIFLIEYGDLHEIIKEYLEKEKNDG